MHGPRDTLVHEFTLCLSLDQPWMTRGTLWSDALPGSLPASLIYVGSDMY
jgi:hypothetical protein